MKAMILAAGRGERMGELTRHCPKPLLPVAGKPLLQHHLERLQAAGFNQVVINASYLGEQIQQFVETHPLNMDIQLSLEAQLLETGGGIFHALPLFGEQPFMVINGDVWSDYPLAELAQKKLTAGSLAHVVLVENPAHNPRGDFGLADGLLLNQPQYTFSGISVISPGLFDGCSPGRFPLAPLLRAAADKSAITAEKYNGYWVDVGTPERLQQVEHSIQEHSE